MNLGQIPFKKTFCSKLLGPQRRRCTSADSLLVFVYLRESILADFRFWPDGWRQTPAGGCRFDPSEPTTLLPAPNQTLPDP